VMRASGHPTGPIVCSAWRWPRFEPCREREREREKGWGGWGGDTNGAEPAASTGGLGAVVSPVVAVGTERSARRWFLSLFFCDVDEWHERCHAM
jgi:hypothetical protein